MKKHKTKKKPIILITILLLALMAVGAIGFYRLPIGFDTRYTDKSG